MLRKASKTVPEGNGPLPQKEELESGQLTMGVVYRLLVERFDRIDSYSDRLDKKLDEISEEMRKMDEHATRLEHGARQPRLAMEADGQASTKTRERTEGAATAVQAMRGDCLYCCCGALRALASLSACLPVCLMARRGCRAPCSRRVTCSSIFLISSEISYSIRGLLVLLLRRPPCARELLWLLVRLPPWRDVAAELHSPGVLHARPSFSFPQKSRIV